MKHKLPVNDTSVKLVTLTLTIYTDTIFAGHHQPLRMWILCLYLMGLNLSNRQIAQELDLDKDVVQDMTTQLTRRY